MMNATFAALLGVAYAQGGGLLKFGGDALLLLYEGEEHAARAARAAFEMRRTLRAIGRPRTSAGAIQLKMHAGLHTGRFHFFLVGESHRELLVAGPGGDPNGRDGGDLRGGRDPRQRGDGALSTPTSSARRRPAGVLLRAAPDVRGGVEPLPERRGRPARDRRPGPLRAQLLEVGPLEGEHRHAAIAFVRFAGTDEIIATEGPGRAADAVEGLVRAIQSGRRRARRDVPRERRRP